MQRFENRSQAGRALARSLAGYGGRQDVLVLALPRGGVPVGYEVAKALGAPLDVFLVRKLGVPGYEELAMGAIASGGVRVLNQDVVQGMHLTSAAIEAVAEREERELLRREQEYRAGRPAPQVRGRTVILVDDGLATGASMRAAVQALRQMSPERIVVAVPTAPPEACAELRRLVDDVVCLMTPEAFGGVGLWYQDFTQTSDEEVRHLLEDASRQNAGGTARAANEPGPGR
jgi:putative phosphoribosyl transferase